MMFRGADVFTAASSNQQPAAHRSQSANATDKSKLIKTGAYEFDHVRSHLWAYRRTWEKSPGAKKSGGVEHAVVV